MQNESRFFIKIQLTFCDIQILLKCEILPLLFLKKMVHRKAFCKKKNSFFSVD